MIYLQLDDSTNDKCQPSLPITMNNSAHESTDLELLDVLTAAQASGFLVASELMRLIKSLSVILVVAR